MSPQNKRMGQSEVFYRNRTPHRGHFLGIGLVGTAVIGLLFPATAHAGDADMDGIDDAVDNCVSFFDPHQTDSDGDNTGDYCDGDLNNDGFSDTLDFALIMSMEGQSDDALDYQRDGVVAAGDIQFWIDALGFGSAGASACVDDPSLCVVDVDPADPDGDGLPDFSTDPSLVDLCPGFYNANANGDADGDGIGDGCDLCVDVADDHLAGIDTDGDGIGNACDADYNNDGWVDTLDFWPFFSCFQSGSYGPGEDCALVDTNGDGQVSVTDWSVFLSQFSSGVVGESGLACADATADRFVCPAYGDLYEQLADASVSDDQDGDGYLSEAQGGTDCDDSDAEIHPGRLDYWGDEIDSNCDGEDGDSASLADATVTIVSREGESDWVGHSMEICDLDGDGLQDFMVGAPAVNDYYGKVGVWFGGGSDSWMAEMNIDDADVVFEGSEKMLFGVEITCGDIDGDGWKDLAITHAEVRVDGTLFEHDITLFYGDGTRWSGVFSDSDADASLVRPLLDDLTVEYYYYETKLQIVDTDNDGAGELVLHYDAESTGTGTAYSYGATELQFAPGARYSGANDFEDHRTMTIADVPSSSRGLGVEMTDFQIHDIDGLDWFYIANMGYGINKGEGIFGPMPDASQDRYSTAELEWLSVRVDTDLDGDCYGGPAQLGFGGTLIEDLDGDGSLDMVLTTPMLWPREADLFGGGVFVIDGIEDELSVFEEDPVAQIGHSHSCGESGTLDVQALSTASFRAEQELSFLGRDLTAVGDVDGDGVNDVLIHEGNTDLDAYVVGSNYPFNDVYWVLSGRVMLEDGVGDMNPEDATLLAFAHATTEEKFGSDVLAGDLDGDGKEDFVFSTPSSDDFAGIVYLYLSEQSGW